MLEALLKGITIGLLLSIAVGPVLFSVIKQSLNNGHKGGMAFAIGVSASDVTLVLIANVFTGLFLRLQSYEKYIGITGSFFLITMGVFFLFFKKVKVNESGKQIFIHRKRDLAKIALSGYFMNLLNPAVIIFWFTISTTLITYADKFKIIIYTTCLIIVFMADIFKVMMAGKIRNRLTPHNITIINRVNGIILIVFGIVLIWGLIMYR